MNRRNFLKLLAPMPFIAPAIVTACGEAKMISSGTLAILIDGKMVDVFGDFEYTQEEWSALERRHKKNKMKTKKLKRRAEIARWKKGKQKRKVMQKHIDFSNQITARLHAAKVDAICLEPKWKGYWKAFWYGLSLRFKRYRRDVRRARR